MRSMSMKFPTSALERGTHRVFFRAPPGAPLAVDLEVRALALVPGSPAQQHPLHRALESSEQLGTGLAPTAPHFRWRELQASESFGGNSAEASQPNQILRTQRE